MLATGLAFCGSIPILALDLFTVGLLNGVKVYVLVVTGHGTRRIRIVGTTRDPAQAWAYSRPGIC